LINQLILSYESRKVIRQTVTIDLDITVFSE